MLYAGLSVPGAASRLVSFGSAPFRSCEIGVDASLAVVNDNNPRMTAAIEKCIFEDAESIKTKECGH